MIPLASIVPRAVGKLSRTFKDLTRIFREIFPSSYVQELTYKSRVSITLAVNYDTPKQELISVKLSKEDFTTTIFAFSSFLLSSFLFKSARV